MPSSQPNIDTKNTEKQLPQSNHDLTMEIVDTTLKDIGFHDKQEWKSANAVYDEHTLRIFGQPVMEDWEIPYMKKLAEIATSQGGVVLEVGFGMGLSAQFIREYNIKKHMIIEANHQVAEKARGFARTSRHPVEILEGLWEDVIDQIPTESIDGILFDTYPLSETEFRNHFPFFKHAYEKLKRGGVFTYFSDEANEFQPLHLQKLVEARFAAENISSEIVRVNPPSDCQYWKDETIIAPKITK